MAISQIPHSRVDTGDVPDETTARAAGGRSGAPIDIIMLTHDRLEHLVATVDALEERTPEPFRLTIVDNASGPAVRNWLAENHHRFERVIFRPTNEHVPAFTHGIAATTSDPFVVTDPDVVVPDLGPSWLARMLDLVERHPDFGLIGVGCDPVNRPPPPVLAPEVIDPATLVDEEIVETGVGTVFQFIRRDALVTNYKSDGQACTNVRRAGYRVGWAPQVRALHLGWDDFRLYPGHLLSKRGGECYPESYGEVSLIDRAPTLEELALAAPIVAEARSRGLSDEALLELAWGGPVLGASLPGCVAVESPGRTLPLEDSAAAIVVLTRPPADRAQELVNEACRIAARLVVALAPLETFDCRTAGELAPAGWTGREAPASGDIPLALARSAAQDASVQERLEASTAEDRERWLRLFAAGAFGKGSLRLWIWQRDAEVEAPDRVTYDDSRLHVWRPSELSAPAARRLGPFARLRDKLDLADRSDVWLGRARRTITGRLTAHQPEANEELI
jgi:hypothetical protein